MGGGGSAPFFLNVGTRQMYEVSFIFQLLYFQWKSSRYPIERKLSLSRDRENAPPKKNHIRISQQFGHDSSHIQLFLQNEPARYQNSSGMSSCPTLRNSVQQSSSWEGIRSAARLYLMLFCKVCSDRLLQIAYWWSAFLQLKVDAKSTVVCGAPHVDPPPWLRGACILEDWW